MRRAATKFGVMSYALAFGILGCGLSPASALEKDANGIWRETASDLAAWSAAASSRCEKIKEVAAAIRPLGVGPTSWAKGTHFQNRFGVPPGDPDYPAMQAGIIASLNKQLVDINARLVGNNLPAVSCSP